TGLAHDAERLAPVDVEVDPVDRADDTLVGEEVRLQPIDLEQPFGHGAPSRRYHCRLVSAGGAPAPRRPAARTTGITDSPRGARRRASAAAARLARPGSQAPLGRRTPSG